MKLGHPDQGTHTALVMQPHLGSVVPKTRTCSGGGQGHDGAPPQRAKIWIQLHSLDVSPCVPGRGRGVGWGAWGGHACLGLSPGSQTEKWGFRHLKAWTQETLHPLPRATAPQTWRGAWVPFLGGFLLFSCPLTSCSRFSSSFFFS